MMNCFTTSTANFRRPRRASQKQRKAARDLGRKRRGKSPDQWKGIALKGAAATAAVGGTAAAVNQLSKRRQQQLSPSEGSKSLNASSSPRVPALPGSKPSRSLPSLPGKASPKMLGGGASPKLLMPSKQPSEREVAREKVIPTLRGKKGSAANIATGRRLRLERKPKLDKKGRAEARKIQDTFQKAENEYYAGVKKKREQEYKELQGQIHRDSRSLLPSRYGLDYELANFRRPAYRTARFSRQPLRSITLNIRYFT